jgi:hypothetical protein
LFACAGAGKTYTFFGPDNNTLSPDVQSDSGIIIRAMSELFIAQQKLASYTNVAISISVQYIEIYDEKVTDLLSGQVCTVSRGDGSVHGARVECVHTFQDVLDVLYVGQARKRFAATAMNERSSRSHTALIVKITQTQAHPPSKMGASSSAHKDFVLTSHLHLLDLAGSERVKKSQAQGARLQEAVGINSSLLNLGRVIAALVENAAHVPYLNCKLTTLLKSAFATTTSGNNCKTTVVINCRPEDKFGDETLQSLRFGERCRMISQTVKAIAATSASEALEILEQSLASVKQRIALMEKKRAAHGNVVAANDDNTYKTLINSYDALCVQRSILLGKDAQLELVKLKREREVM